MLLTKEVEITLAGKWIKYYEDLGYEIPKVTRHYGGYESGGSYERTMTPNGTKIKVKIEDVPKGSSTARVQCQCDNCGKITEMSYSKYNKLHTENGITYCKQCNHLWTLRDKHWNWNPNKTEEDRISRRDISEYSVWTKSVLARDKYTCQKCGKPNDKYMAAHHIDSYDWCVEKRFDVKNGITLCGVCHKNFHMLYGYGNNTKEQFAEWYKKPIGELLDYNGEIPTCKPKFCIETQEYIPNVKQYSKDNDLCTTDIYMSANTLNSYKGNHYVDYEYYITLSQDKINEIILSSNVDTKRKIVQLDLNGNIINIFNSIKDACLYLNLGRITTSIGCVCRHKKGFKTAHGYKWEYLDYYYHNINSQLSPLELLNKYRVVMD